MKNFAMKDNFEPNQLTTLSNYQIFKLILFSDSHLTIEKQLKMCQFENEKFSNER